MSVIIDDIPLIDIGIRAKEDSEVMGVPATRDNVVTIPGKHGARHMGSWLEPKPFNLNCKIINRNNASQLMYASRELAKLFLDQYARPKEVKYVNEAEPNKFYTVKYVGSISIEKLASYGDFELPLVAYDPYAYLNVYADEVTWGSQDITFNSFDYTFGHHTLGGTIHVTTPTTETITVSGYALKPIFEITGSASSLTVSSNGRSFSLPSFSNATWTINCENYTVLKDGSSAFNEVDLPEFWLEVGNNDITIDGSGIDIDLRIKFRDKYM